MTITPKPGETVREFVKRGGRFDEDLVTPERQLHGWAEKIRRELPPATAEIMQSIVDNPGKFALVFSFDLVTMKCLANIMKADSLIEVLAIFFLVMTMGTGLLMFLTGASKGLITFGIAPVSAAEKKEAPGG